MPTSADPDTEMLHQRMLRVSKDQYGSGYDEAILELYKVYLEMADRVSQRRQSSNSFYLSINTVFLTGFAFFGASSGQPIAVITVCILGFAMCLMWSRSISSYSDLNSGKFSILNAIEEMLPIAPYSEEWEVLERGTNRKRFRPFHKVERAVPVIFSALYLMIALTNWLEVKAWFLGFLPEP